MNQEPPTIGYDQLFLKPLRERISIFNQISAENRALLIKTHAERWLAANRSRFTPAQLAIVEECIRSISPEWYKTERVSEQTEQEVAALRRKAEAVLSPEDVLQLMSIRAEYVPAAAGEDERA
ncbi:MAG TPA: hypothetical protein VF546_25035 [Pyrinomonadaceae bacterium]|jgi:hypothetical protein